MVQVAVVLLPVHYIVDSIIQLLPVQVVLVQVQLLSIGVPAHPVAELQGHMVEVEAVDPVLAVHYVSYGQETQDNSHQQEQQTNKINRRKANRKIT
jgi:hypothetical protein